MRPQAARSAAWRKKMAADASMNRREFLQKSTLLAAARHCGRNRDEGGRADQQHRRPVDQARQARVHRRRHPRHTPDGGRLGHCGRAVGRRRGLLQGPSRSREGAHLARTGRHRRLRRDHFALRHRRGGDCRARPLAPEDDAGGAGGRQARLRREADDARLGGGRGVHRRRREERQGGAGRQPVHEHGRREEGGRVHQERAPGPGHARRRQDSPQ